MAERWQPCQSQAAVRRENGTAEDALLEKREGIRPVDAAGAGLGRAVPAEWARIVRVRAEELASLVAELRQAPVGILVVRIPMWLGRQRRRRRRLAPDGSELIPATKPQPDGVLVKALARAWRWQRLLDGGVCSSVTEITEAERISKSYVSRILRLALLAPDIVEAILGGWEDQRAMPERLERPPGRPPPGSRHMAGTTPFGQESMA